MMLVIRGRFAEARVYWRHVLALFRPGIEVPTFGEPARFTGDIERLTDEDLKLVVEEGRRQLDRQLADLNTIRSRAATLLTFALAVIAVLSASAYRAFARGLLVSIGWAASVTLAVLAIGGAMSLLTSQAVFGRADTRQAAEGSLPVLRTLALGYARAVGPGEETIRTRVTVLRDGMSLAVASALLYALIWPFVSNPTAASPSAPAGSPSGAPTICLTTCTTSSPSPPSPTPTAVPGPSATSPISTPS